MKSSNYTRGKHKPNLRLVKLKDLQKSNAAFVGALDRAIEFHRNNTNDPHNIGTAVMVAITEVRDAFKAHICSSP